MERNFRVSAKDEGQRLDRWLMAQLPSQSRKQIKGLLDAGCVLVNGRRVVIAGWELADGDEVEVRRARALRPSSASEERAQTEPERPYQPKPHAGSKGISDSIDRHLARRKAKRKRARHARPEGEPVRVKVYHQDRDIVVVEKPGGLLAVPKDKSDARDSMIERVRAYLRRRFKKGKASFVSPLHRLDAETSGIMVFALSKAGQRLSEQFRSHAIQRSYQALVLGSVERESGTIDKPLEKGDFGGGRKVRRSRGDGGKRAITDYRVKERYKDATLLDVTVRTGRTHQIRVHLASEGYPIIGDALYAKELEEKHPKIMDEVDRTLGFRRHALHAISIGFKHPASGKKMKFRSPIPNDMHALIDYLRGQA